MSQKRRKNHDTGYGRSRRRRESALSYALKRLLCFLGLIALAAVLILGIRYIVSGKSVLSGAISYIRELPPFGGSGASSEAYGEAENGDIAEGSETIDGALGLNGEFEENDYGGDAGSGVDSGDTLQGAEADDLAQGGSALGDSSSDGASGGGQGSEGEEDANADSGEASDEAQEKTTAKLLFAGDIYLSDHVLNAHDRAGGISGILSPDLVSIIEGADIFMANLEFPFSDRGTPEEDKSFTFRVSPSRAGLLREIGVDIVSLANNHTLDFGTDALMDTITALDGIDIGHTGAGNDLASANEAVIREIGGKRFAFLGASRVLPFADWTAGKSSPGLNSIYDPYKSRIFDKLSELSETTDYQIVYIHWGTEEKDTPDDYMRSLAKELIDAGADLIIGSHPHVLQGIEYIDGVPVAYSLGNFLFGSVIESTLLLSVDWDLISGEPKLSIHPANGASGYTQSISDETELAAFNAYYEGLCKQLAE